MKMNPKIFQDALEVAVLDIATKAQLDAMTTPIAMVEFLLACLQQSASDEVDVSILFPS
jgi:hypothetical protein